MRPYRLQPERQPAALQSKNPAAAAITLFAAAFCAGCANPGPPKPPSLHLPALVKDLQADRAGDQVLLRWTTPSRTTDDMDIKGAITAELCREVGDRPAGTVARAACAPVRRLSVTAGPSQVADTLPPALQAGPATLLTYRVQLFNATGHSAGDSTSAYAAAGPSPAAVDSLRATASEQGAVLEWKNTAHSSTATDSMDTVFMAIDRVDLSVAPAERKAKSPANRLPGAAKRTGTSKPVEPSPVEVHLRAADTSSAANSDTAGTVDTAAVMGDTYTYSAQRVRTVTLGSRQLEIRSAPSPTVTLAMRDTFPPKPPTGLATISGVANPNADAIRSGLAYSGPASVPYIDLSWEPNAETDLAGYRVYRQLARPDGSPQGPLARLTALPLPAPAYRDVAVRPGQRYIYTVTAVDAAGNESAPSAKAMEIIPAEAGDAPH